VGHYNDTNGTFHSLVYGSTWNALDEPSAASGPGVGTLAQGISGSNIVGYFYDSSNHIHGFFYNGSSWNTLDDPLATNRPTYASAVFGGKIVGYYQDASGSVFHGFVAAAAPPQLSIGLAGGIVTISWAYPSAGWTLQENPDLATPIGQRAEVFPMTGQITLS
jgi:hypothetical protein